MLSLRHTRAQNLQEILALPAPNTLSGSKPGLLKLVLGRAECRNHGLHNVKLNQGDSARVGKFAAVPSSPQSACSDRLPRLEWWQEVARQKSSRKWRELHERIIRINTIHITGRQE